MIDQNKVRRMSRMAMMEADVGKQIVKMYGYSRVDYALMEMLKGFFVGSACFAALLVLWLGFIWDDLNLFFADAQYVTFFWQVLKGYGIFVGIYLILCAIVAVVRYNKYDKKRKLYLKYLRSLQKSYASEGEEENEG